MNYAEAVELVKAIAVIDAAVKVKIEHRGFLAARTPESEMDGKWEVVLTSANARTGNLHMSRIEDPSADAKVIVREFRAKAKAQDGATRRRIAAERDVDRS